MGKEKRQEEATKWEERSTNCFSIHTVFTNQKRAVGLPLVVFPLFNLDIIPNPIKLGLYLVHDDYYYPYLDVTGFVRIPQI